MTDTQTKPGLDAEESLNRLIDARYSPEDDRRIAQSWAESARQFNLADEHVTKALQLIDEGASS